MNTTTKSKSRLLIVLIGLLLISNLATALVAFMSIKRLDENYTEELSETSSGLQKVIMLAQDCTNIHRAAGNLLLARNEQERQEFWMRVQALRKKESDQLAKVLVQVPPSAGSPMEPLWLASLKYSQALDEMLALVKQGDIQAAQAYRLDQLRPIFDQYQNSQIERSVHLSREAMLSNSELTSTADTHKKLLLGFGGWPFAVLLLMVVGAGFLGAVLWRLLRQIERDEAVQNANRHF